MHLCGPQTSPPPYPLFLKLGGRRCLVVGGGAIAVQKTEDLLLAGAAVTVVTKTASPAMQQLANEGRLALELRAFAPSDAEGCRVVIAATDDEATNRAVYAAGQAASALVNVVDVVSLCDFYTGGVVRRGPVQVVIGTGGASPSLARRLRLHLEEALPASLGALAAALGSARPRLLRRYPAFKKRAQVLGAFVDGRFAAAMRGETEDDDAAVQHDLLDD